ncbi:MAG: tyrosine-type recombinase/integrase, partial [Nitrososphaerales archaeon]
MRLNWDALDGFLEKMYRRSRSEHSKRFYANGIKSFRSFCEEKNVRSISSKNPYTVLDSYVAWLDKKDMKPKTITDYVSAVRKFLSYLDVEIEPSKFKAKVTMPRVTKIADEPLKVEDVRTILSKGRPSPKTRALILLLLSSGMRIGEALSLRVSDLELDSEPVKVKVRAEYSKARTARAAYMSYEAREALRQLVRDAAKDRLVFDYSGGLWEREKVCVRTFRQVVERAGLGEKIENHRIHKIHFHSFRKFFFTKAADLLGEHIAHALCGHGFYMDTYYRKSEEERKQDYLKLMPLLT